MNRVIFQFLALCLVVLWLTAIVAAQSTEFTYQGRLLSGDVPANGNHDFEFTLWDAETSGNQIGSTVTLTAVNVNNGVFSVRIDFGNQFPGANRFLEIKVRQSGSGATFTTLTPRQAVSSSPYAIKSINAENASSANTAVNASQLGGIAAHQFVITTDSRLTNARVPLPNSPNYIQNTTLQQALSNFNISGDGVVGGSLTASAFTGNGLGLTNLNAGNIAFGTLNNARLGIVPVNKGGTGLTAPGVAGSFLRSNGSAWISSILAPTDLPAGNTSYIQNSTSQQAASNFNISGNGTVGGTLSANVLNAGTQLNMEGHRALVSVTNNLYIGRNAGASNQGDNNTFVGVDTGLNNTGTNNSFFGDSAGQSNTSGSYNSFLGDRAGFSNQSGSNNTAVGRDSGVGGVFNNATAIGASAIANGEYATAIGANAFSNGDDLLVLGKLAGTYGGVVRPADRVFVRGTLTVFSLANASSTTLCRNGNVLSFCSSSIRYKENISSFSPGLSLVKQLHPVLFNWKSDSSLDFGLVAEEVAKVEPLLITRNDKGDIEGVKYDRVGVVLLNAVTEQQQQIESQQKKIERQQKQLEYQSQTIRGQQAELAALKRFICTRNPKTQLCRPKN